MFSVSGSVRGAEGLKTPTLNMRIIAHRIPSSQLSTARLRFITQEVTHHPPPQSNHVLYFPRPNSAADRAPTSKSTHTHTNNLYPSIIYAETDPTSTVSLNAKHLSPRIQPVTRYTNGFKSRGKASPVLPAPVFGVPPSVWEEMSACINS